MLKNGGKAKGWSFQTYTTRTKKKKKRMTVNILENLNNKTIYI